jgi:putative NADH-flavin reductase
MNILIFGASGATGHQLVTQALEQRHQVTAFVRNPAKFTLSHKRLRVIQGNINECESVEQAVEGHDAVLSALGANSPFTFDQALVDGLSTIINAMESARMNRLIYLSFVGVNQSRRDAGLLIRHVAPKLLRTEIAGHEARESIIRQCRLNWIIVRAPMLTNGPLTKTYRSGENLRSSSFAVRLSRADTADFMLTQLTDTRFVGKAVCIMP